MPLSSTFEDILDCLALHWLADVKGSVLAPSTCGPEIVESGMQSMREDDGQALQAVAVCCD